MKTRTRTTTIERLKQARRPRRSLIAAGVFAALALAAPLVLSGPASAKPSAANEPRPTIVLVHGDWADASSWNPVIERLQHRGHTVVAPPNPLRGPTSDALHLRSFLLTIDGPIVLVAHSYGGFVATNAATGVPNVKALVYVDAFVPDLGQTLLQLLAGSCLDPLTAFNIVPSSEGVDLYLRREPKLPYQGFFECFANDVDREQAAVLFAGQRPAAANQIAEPSGVPAWKTIPAWSLIGTADHVITPAMQRAMSTTAGAHISTVDTGHLSLVTRPKTVTDLIETAIKATA